MVSAVEAEDKLVEVGIHTLPAETGRSSLARHQPSDPIRRGSRMLKLSERQAEMKEIRPTNN
jgi:hypothetical protein